MKNILKGLKIVLFGVFFLFSCFFTGCKKEPVVDKDKISEQKLKENAEHNNTIIPGLGNVFLAKDLQPNTISQLVSIANYSDFTLATYGSTNADAKVDLIHTTIIARNNFTELHVTEIHPDNLISRSYNIDNGIKSRLVMQTEHINATDLIISLLDMDWATGNSKTIISAYSTNGIFTDNYVLKKKGDSRSSLCALPEITDVSKMQYYLCMAGVRAFEPGMSFYDWYKIAYPDDPFKNSGIPNGEKEKLEKYNGIDFERVAIQFENFPGLEGIYDDKTAEHEAFKRAKAEALYKKLNDGILDLRTGLVSYLSQTAYNEVTGQELKLVAQVMDNENGVFYPNAAYITMLISNPADRKLLYTETETTDPATGIATLTFNPKILIDYESMPDLWVSFVLKGAKYDYDLLIKNKLTFAYIKPKVVFTNKSNLPATVKFSNGISQYFILVNEDGKDITVDYQQLTLKNNANTNGLVSVTGIALSNLFELKLSTNETPMQTTSFDVYYKSKKVQTIKAEVMDSLEIYKAACVGWWTVNGYDPINPMSTYTLELFGNGSGTYHIAGNPTTYNITWEIRKSGNEYRLFEGGFWHPAYNGLKRDKLTYPLSKFRTYADFDPNFVNQEYIKN